MVQLRKVKYAYSVLAGCLIIIGFLLMFFPDSSVVFFYRASGIVLIILGLVKIAGYFSKDLFQLAFQFDFAMGCVFACVGFLTLVQTKRMMEVATVCIGMVVILDALLRVQTAIEAKKFGLDHWWMLLLVSLCVAFIGILLVTVPFCTVKVMIQLIGINLCIDGILNLVTVQSTVEIIRRKNPWEHYYM